ncbi:nucleoside recognition domain-containing protein [Marinisporobacter balticus]|uniref:Nucleoside recognition protein n=1 Tax=Marinisporobacter balticus TaxID=2018667 RepID=A0A4R2KBS6_9FIRM|nr:nucleoside recognition domain-containing protein [Marinisporobacter balticus]TCO69692.1 nucleoside recognition protein [Marinisporobacter balticus]
MLLESIKLGIKKGIETTWMLAKVIIPVYIFITFLQHTPVLNWIAYAFKPFMGLFHLPGEAAIVLVLGNTLNLYAAIGAIRAIELTPMQITTLGIMLSFSHSLFVETAVVKKLDVSVSKFIALRIGLAVVVGMIVGQVGELLC